MFFRNMKNSQIYPQIIPFILNTNINSYVFSVREKICLIFFLAHVYESKLDIGSGVSLCYSLK